MNEAEALLASVGEAELKQAVAQQSAKRFADISAGVNRFISSGYKRTMVEPPVLWGEGSSKLYDYGMELSETVMLFVPSLINKSYIFDISPAGSMLQFYRKQGLACALLDWGQPTKDEQGFEVENYVARLLAVIKYIKSEGKEVVLVGHCLGGLLSLAAAQMVGDAIKGLACLATPWDFKTADVKTFAWNKQFVTWFEQAVGQHQVMASELVYYLLYLQDPWAVHDKYARFATMDKNSNAAQSFIERESWVHDGVPLAAKVAYESFIDWGVNNATALGKWSVGGEIINPAQVNVPSFVAIAGGDVIVPQLCASALVKQLKDAQAVLVPSGHVGMIIGTKAKQHLWLPLANWAKAL